MTKLVESERQVGSASYSSTIEPGDQWMYEIRQGQVLRIVDREGQEAADTLFFDARNKAIRYSAVDTIRAAGNLYLSTGSRLLSQTSELLLTIVADTCGRHDTVGGACACESNSVRYPSDRRFMHACRESWLLALGGLAGDWDKRDLANNINFFMNVPVSPGGDLRFDDGLSGPGAYVELRAERDVLATISNCPQLNNPCSGFDPTPLDVWVWEA